MKLNVFVLAGAFFLLFYGCNGRDKAGEAKFVFKPESVNTKVEITDDQFIRMKNAALSDPKSISIQRAYAAYLSNRKIYSEEIGIREKIIKLPSSDQDDKRMLDVAIKNWKEESLKK
ncbi:MAG: hypothetical protein NTX57_22050 [Armatimonadetes bacterium]|jgi:hypothetical protein|nr:hypothetical protein [Armatimonadota bacterium]